VALLTRRRRWFAALALTSVLAGIPAVLAVASFLQDTPVRAGEPAPRTVIAPDLIRVSDPDATERARREAAAAVEPVLVGDAEARAAIVQRVRDVFAAAAAAREPGDDDQPASRPEQVAALRDRLTMLDEDGLRLLVGLSDAELERVAGEAVDIAQQLARERIAEEDLDGVADGQLQTELIVRSLPEGVADAVVAPVIRDALVPTVRVDEQATADARDAAAGAVDEVVQSYLPGTAIVSSGQVVTEAQMAALRLRGLEGADPVSEALRAAILAAVLTGVVCLYLRTYRQEVWRSTRRLVLVASLALLFTVALEGVGLMGVGSSSRYYLIPIGAVIMLATILFDPPLGVLMVVPLTALVAYTAPAEIGVVAFTAVAGLVSIPLVSRLSDRKQLRRAAWQSTAAYTVLAGTLAGVFSGAEAVLPAMLAGLLNGVLTAVVVNGSLPFLESTFGILTATSLLDLADRNHPLLRELEQKALGSYNHSIMVSTLVERACRAIGADSLLGSVAALYHDIGKVRRPYFFVENQFGIANPHDDLEPAVSAVIIQEHVKDGVTMARSYRLPPEVVEGIATHHGTTVVSYFHRRAVRAAGGAEHVDEAHYRYKGRKPASREMALLMLADCCEATSRAAAQADRNLSKAALEDVVHSLVAERVSDGQLDESALTFADLRTAQESFIETLVGVYHPRISYPDPVAPVALAAPAADGAAVTPATADPVRAARKGPD